MAPKSTGKAKVVGTADDILQVRMPVIETDGIGILEEFRMNSRWIPKLSDFSKEIAIRILKIMEELFE